jgi:signal transduction histidine kinase/CheY-like chemotaxis protein/PAS domain-containing protein
MPWPIPSKFAWADLPLRTKCLLLISFPALATVAMTAAAHVLSARIAAAEDQVQRALETGREIESLHAAETEISADVRAYFLTADETFAGRTRASLTLFDAVRLQLTAALAGLPGAPERLARIGELENAREERMFGDMARFRSHILSREQVLAELKSVQQARLQIQNLLESVARDNRRGLEATSGHIVSLRSEQSAITATCLFGGLLGGIAMSLLFARGITSRIARIQRNIAGLDAGAEPQIVAGRDEIAVLNQGVLHLSRILRRKTLALSQALHGIAEVDADGHCVWCNKVFEEATGIFRKDGPVHISSLVQPRDRPRLEHAVAELPGKGRSEIAVRLDASSSSAAAQAADVALSLLSLSSDSSRNAGFIVFLRDLWGGKRADAALIRAKEAAEASNRAKTEFLAKISHDIRTPLNAILGSADLLSQTPLSFDQNEYVNMFQRNCRRLVALINDFLDFSRIEAGAVRIERSPYRVREAVLDAAATFREPAARKGVALGVEIDAATPECVLGDAWRIQQILVNLLSNALKFTSAGSVEVHVRVLTESAGGDKLRFEVSDSGPGIRLEDQDKIFARFVQLPHASNGQRGAGLGLTICRDLVDLMGGEIGVASREGKGSTFYFNLPLEAVDPALTAPQDTAALPPTLAVARPLKILLAEDNEDNRLLVAHYLRDQTVELCFAANGHEAVEAVRSGESFDLVLMDIDMPGMDGYTATRQIRAFEQSQPSGTPSRPSTPIVALSADALQDAVDASLEAGCVAHVAKPVDRQTLLRTIRRFGSLKLAEGALAARKQSISDQVKALVPQYLASKSKQIEEARASLAARDFGPIRRFGHNLKGTGKGYGFPAIEEFGRELERAAVEADAKRIASQLDALHRFVSQSAETLANS